jgi:hypothetical protein
VSYPKDLQALVIELDEALSALDGAIQIAKEAAPVAVSGLERLLQEVLKWRDAVQAERVKERAL